MSEGSERLVMFLPGAIKRAATPAPAAHNISERTSSSAALFQNQRRMIVARLGDMHFTGSDHMPADANFAFDHHTFFLDRMRMPGDHGARFKPPQRRLIIMLSIPPQNFYFHPGINANPLPFIDSDRKRARRRRRVFGYPVQNPGAQSGLTLRC